MVRTHSHHLAHVPEVTALFWIAKLITTAGGESTSDYLVQLLGPYVAVPLGAVVFVLALVIQFRTKRYVPFAYWFAVAMVALFGTMVADVIHIQFGIPYPYSTVGFLLILAVVFTWWYRVEHSLSIHEITTKRREMFYWLTVIATFALGTAAGDWTAYSLHLGYFHSGVLFAAVMLIPILGALVFRANSIAMFWLAYIITRPLGASFADWFGKPHTMTGLGYGDGTVSLVLWLLLIGAVCYMVYNRPERKAETPRV